MEESSTTAPGPDDDQKERAAFWRDEFAVTARKLGDVIRQLSLAGFAGIWVLKGEGTVDGRLADRPLASAFLFVCALTADLLHGVVNSWTNYHGMVHFSGGRRGPAWEHRLAAKVSRARVGTLLFSAKLVLMVFAYGFLLTHAAAALRQ
jgi:hypothetical protein